LAPEILTFEGPMDVANVMLICPKCGERSRVGYRRDEDGGVSRVCKSCEELLDA
jgi:large subunit ribosomal protein L24